MMNGATNRRKGITAERALVTWLRHHGWPQAERSVVTGYRTTQRERRDGGDITGTPGICWSLKDHSTERINAWWEELQRMDGGPLRLLIVKNRGHADPGEWWVWLTLKQQALLLSTVTSPLAGNALVRMQLVSLQPTLHRAGYGELETSLESRDGAA